MAQALTVITPPEMEPVTLDEAKAQCRVDVNDDDALINGLIITARERIETLALHAALTQTLELVLDDWPLRYYVQMPKPPLQSVVSVHYTLENGQDVLWDAANYITATAHVPGRVVLAPNVTWPSDIVYPTEAVRIRYVAGWTGREFVPQSLKQAMLLLISYWYENREAVLIGAGLLMMPIPFGVEALTWSYRERARIR